MEFYHQRDVLYIEKGDVTLIREKNNKGLYDISLGFDKTPFLGGPHLFLVYEGLTKEDWRGFKEKDGIEKLLERADSILMDQLLHQYFLC